jgi:hypothetical protein
MQKIPVGQEFILMQLSPCFDQSALFLGDRSCNQIHEEDGEDCGLVLKISVEVGKMVGRAGF